MNEAWRIALGMVFIISIVYLTIDYFYGIHIANKRTKLFNTMEEKIKQANTIDELIDLRKEAWGNKVLLGMIDRKLDKMIKE